MGWKEVSMFQQKNEFIQDVLRQNTSFGKVCINHQISRKTGYKWYYRFLESGNEGLKELSRAPHKRPNQLDPEVIRAILSIKGEFKHWGPRKIHARIQSHFTDLLLPSKSSVENVLKSNNLTMPRVFRRRVPKTAPLGHCSDINEIWCYDFKGWFLTGDGQKCEPLTITDAHSRYLLKCIHVNKKSVNGVWAILDQAFHEFGLPLRIRSDNGFPFATVGVGRLSKLAIMLIKAGVTPEWIAPGKPQENGRHERFHLTLKTETASPPAQTLKEQEELMIKFQDYYNFERPHESLGQKVPASVYRCSPRLWDGRFRAPEYDDRFEKRKVMKCGSIAWLGKNYFLSESLYGEYVGIEQYDNGIFDTYYGSIFLGRIDVKKGFKKYQ
jgi:putative transposase